jgi:hypothetical protein
MGKSGDISLSHTQKNGANLCVFSHLLFIPAQIFFAKLPHNILIETKLLQFLRTPGRSDYVKEIHGKTSLFCQIA